MSRPRSRSPNYRRFAWEEPGFDAYKVNADLDGDSMDRRHHHHFPREAPGEHWSYTRKDPEGQRRSPFQDDHHFGHHRPSSQEEFHHRRASPSLDKMAYEDRRHSPPREGGEDGGRRIGGFREAYPNFEDRGRSPASPPRLKRERLPQTPRPSSDQQQQQRDQGMGWRREGQGRGPARFGDLSPSARSDDHRGGSGRERGRRNMKGPQRDQQWESPNQERSPHFKRQRREMEDTDNRGYGNDEHFGVQRYSVDSSRDRFKGERQGSLPRGDDRHSGPVIIEHGHGMSDRREPARWEQSDDRRGRDYDFDHRKSPATSSQERFRTPESRPGVREDTRAHSFQEDRRDSHYHENMRTSEESPQRFGIGNSPTSHRGRGGFRPGRGRFKRGQFGRTGPPHTEPRPQHSFQNQDLDDRPRQAYQPFRKDYEEKPNLAEDRPQRWEAERPRNPPPIDLDPKMPRQRLRQWSEQKTNNAAVGAEETLTIKVDMSQPVKKNSPLCYSSDRQLSLDLVNVGRQRLEFLPMLEHSGTYRETAMHTGTFAQEIITLVHSVKEQYFRDEGLSLNERFSSPQKGGYSEEEEEEVEELMLNDRFSSNRGFSVNMDSVLDDVEPLFSRLGSLPPTRGPGDLRHDLERRRQERLEGVKVTILGNRSAQRPQAPISDPDPEYEDDVEDEEFSDWTEEPSRRPEGNVGPRRGAPFRPNAGPQRRNHRFGNRFGQMRRQNFRNNPAGPNW